MEMQILIPAVGGPWSTGALNKNLDDKAYLADSGSMKTNLIARTALILAVLFWPIASAHAGASNSGPAVPPIQTPAGGGPIGVSGVAPAAAPVRKTNATASAVAIRPVAGARTNAAAGTIVGRPYHGTIVSLDPKAQLFVLSGNAKQTLLVTAKTKVYKGENAGAFEDLKVGASVTGMLYDAAGKLSAATVRIVEIRPRVVSPQPAIAPAPGK